VFLLKKKQKQKQTNKKTTQLRNLLNWIFSRNQVRSTIANHSDGHLIGIHIQRRACQARVWYIFRFLGHLSKWCWTMWTAQYLLIYFVHLYYMLATNSWQSDPQVIINELLRSQISIFSQVLSNQREESTTCWWHHVVVDVVHLVNP